MKQSAEPRSDAGDELSEQELAAVVGGLEQPWLDTDDLSAAPCGPLRVRADESPHM